LVVITQLQPITALFPIPEDNLPRVMKRMQSGKRPVEAFDRAQKVKLGTESCNRRVRSTRPRQPVEFRTPIAHCSKPARQHPYGYRNILM
jgi:hypothetical protein